MHYEEMLSWLLFYTSLLDVSKLPVRDVLDPGGLVKSQVLQTAGGELRLVLNASLSKRALVLALPVGGVRLGRAAYRLRHLRHPGHCPAP